MNNKGELLIYKSEEGITKIDVNMQDETACLTQQQMAEVFSTSRTNIVEHIKNINDKLELDENSTCRKSRQVEFSIAKPRKYMLLVLIMMLS